METEMTDWLQAPSQQELQGSKLWWKLRSGTRLRHAAREHVEDWLSTEIIVSGVLLSQIDGHAFSRRWLKREDRKKQKRAQQLLRCSAKLKKKQRWGSEWGVFFHFCVVFLPLVCFAITVIMALCQLPHWGQQQRNVRMMNVVPVWWCSFISFVLLYLLL